MNRLRAPLACIRRVRVWAEALARYYADIHYLSSLYLRIGWANVEDYLGSEKSGEFCVVKETLFGLCNGRSKRLIPRSSIFFTAFLTADGIGLISNTQNVF